MKYALVSPQEQAYRADGAAIDGGKRVAQVEAQAFPAHPSLWWVECPDDATAEGFYFDGEAVMAKPLPPEPEE